MDVEEALQVRRAPLLILPATFLSKKINDQQYLKSYIHKTYYVGILANVKGFLVSFVLVKFYGSNLPK